MGLLRVLAAAAACGVVAYALGIRRKRRPGRALSDSSAHLLSLGPRRLMSRLLDAGGFFGVDVGGSLTKVMFFAPDSDAVDRVVRRAPTAIAAEWAEKLAGLQRLSSFLLSRETYGRTGVRDAHLSFHMPELGGTLHFVRFETRRMEGAMRIARAHGLGAGSPTLRATGGGAVKYRDLARSLLGVSLRPLDEINCLVRGMAFLMGQVGGEAYTWRGREVVARKGAEGAAYPYLLVNVGSGVGFILVTGEGAWQRVSGTSLGGGTYYGLCHSLTGIASFDAMLDAAEQGENAHVDLTVGDIYGGDYGRFGLKASTIAASFGKAVTWSHLAGSGGVGPDGRGRADSEETTPDGSFRCIGGVGPSLTQATQLRAAAASAGSTGLAESRLVPDSTSKREWAAAAGGAGADGEAAATAAGIGSAASGPAAEPADPFARNPTGLTPRPGAERERDATASGPIAPATQQPAGAEDCSAPAPGPAVAAAPAPAAAAAASAPVRHDPRDMSRALLIMISNNIAQLAYLVARQHACRDIYFAGNFLRHENTIAMRTLAYAIHFWSGGAMEGLFLKHEGYCGALGAFLSTLDAAEEDAAARGSAASDAE